MRFLHRPVSWPSILLLTILSVAALFRLRGVDFGLPSLHDPDEPLFMLFGYKLLSEGTLNPGWFGHPGTTTIYTIAVLEAGTYLYGWLAGHYADARAFGEAIHLDPGVIILPVRYFMVIGGVLCVYLTHRVAARLFDQRIALLAAALLAINPLHIQYSQIVRTDIHATIFMLLCVLCSLNIYQKGRLKDYLFASAMVGLAVASKWPAAVIGICPLIASLLRSLDHPDSIIGWKKAWVMIAGASVLSLLIVSPYLLLDYQTLLTNLRGEARPTNLGGTGTGFVGNLIWYLTRAIPDSVGWAGLALMAVGFGVSVRKSRIAAGTIGAVTVIMLIALSLQSLIWPRWILTILPFISIFIAVGIVFVTERLLSPDKAFAREALLGGILAVVAIPMLISVEARAAERANDTRARASHWAWANIPRGSTVAVEYVGFDLFGHGWPIYFPVGGSGCVDAEKILRGDVKYSEADKMRGKSAMVNLGTIDPARLDSCRTDYVLLSFYDRYLDEAAQFPDELASYAALLKGGTILQKFRPAPGKSGGPVVRVVKLAPKSPANSSRP